MFIIFIAITGGHTTEISSSDLGEIVFQGDDIIVYGEKQPFNAALKANEITLTELQGKGAQTIAEALEYVSGVDIQNGGKGESHLSIRGFEQKSSKILIDGVPVYEGFFGIVDLSAVPVQAVQKIVIEKGATSVLYGANTMGGVVNIITRKGTGLRKSNISLALGDNNTRKLASDYSDVMGKLSYYLGYSWRSSDGMRMSNDYNAADKWIGVDSEYREDGDTRELSDYNKQSFLVNLGYKAGADKVDLSLSYFTNEHGCPVEQNRYWRFADWHQWQISLAGEKRISSAAIFNTRLFYVNHGDELVDDAERTIEAGGKSWFDKSRYDDYSLGGEVHLRIIPNKRNLIRVGLNYQQDRNKQTEYNPRNNVGDIIFHGWTDIETYEADTYCIGAEDLFRFTDRLFVTLGASYVTCHISGNMSLIASIARKTRFPRMVELYSSHTGGNPDLKAEQTIASEAGIECNISNYAYIAASFFHNDIDNLIESVKDESGSRIYLNIGEARFYGWETQLRSTIISGLDFRGNYTYLYATDEVDDIEIACRPRHKLNLSVVYKLPADLSSTFYGTYVGRQVQYYNENGATLKRAISDYFLANAKVAYKMFFVHSKTSEFFITVKNILDRNYDEGNGPMPGRSILAGINVTI